VHAVFVPQGETIPLSKPKGGYYLIPAVRLAMAWWAYHEKLIRLVDLRVWFAAGEVLARRCRRSSPLACRFGLDELQGLTGLSPKRLRESLRRLEAAQLLAWSESAIEFGTLPGIAAFSDRNGFQPFLDQIPNHRRQVPVPRRILRLMAGGARPALIAAVLGHLLRCLYLKGGKCLDRGRVKASWIADTFGVSLRRVKEARKELIAIGWLIPIRAEQWQLNRWGSHVRINLNWSRLDGITSAPRPAKPPSVTESIPDGGDGTPAATASGPELAPPAPDSGPELAPPDSDEEPLWDDKNQEPAAGGPAGFYLPDPDQKNADPGRTQPEGHTLARRPSPALPASAAAVTVKPRPCSARRTGCPALGTPDLRHVVPEDLTDTGRLLGLYDQAADLGLITSSEYDQLRFVAAAEHARIIGTKNPCGLFVRLVRGRLLHFVTYDDEVAASVRLRRHLYGGTTGSRFDQKPAVRPRPELSTDARLVQAVRAAAVRAGYRGDAFPLLKREEPEWTKERWDRAIAEL
jgi:hypothetical protein